MAAASPPLAGNLPAVPSCVALAPPPAPPEPCTPAEVRALVHGGLTESDACEALLAQSARVQGALDLAIGDGLAALALGDRLISLGFSCLRDYAREVLDVAERTAESMTQLSRALRARPLLQAAVRSGEVRPRAALAVLPVATRDAEAAWVERARTETIRALEKAVRSARGGDDDEDEWTRFRVRVSAEERTLLDEALALAGRQLPGSTRTLRLESMAQEYLGGHPTEAGDDGAGPAGGAFGPDRAAGVEERKATLEAETERWRYLAPVSDVRAADDVSFDFAQMRSAREIDRALRALAERRARWDRTLGYCAYLVKRSGVHLVAGFASFEHYCAERLGLAPRTVEQRAAVEKRLWALPTLRAARDAGLAYEKVRILSRLSPRELEPWIPRAWRLTAIALRAAVEERDEAQMRAARTLRARVPLRIALLLQAAFRAVRATEGQLLDDGRCLVRLARHYLETYGPVPRPRTLSQKVRERDRCRCQVPGCSRMAAHGHHIVPRSRGGADTQENIIGVCAIHHLRGIHGGYVRVRGRAPDRLVWEAGGRIFDGGIGPLPRPDRDTGPTIERAPCA